MKTPIAHDFEISDEMRMWAEARVSMVNIDVETEKFIDYWLSTGKVMADWTATWRQWMRRCTEFKGACLYTRDELTLKRLMAEFVVQGFRRAFKHENAVMYSVAFDAWKLRDVPKRDMASIVTSITREKCA